MAAYGLARSRSRLLGVVERFRYSRGNEPDALTATARTPCWAINLAAIDEYQQQSERKTEFNSLKTTK